MKNRWRFRNSNVLTSIEVDVNVGDILEYYGTWGTGNHEFRTSNGLGIFIQSKDFEECLEKLPKSRKERYIKIFLIW